MSNILLWVKGNYEKVILCILSILLIMTGLLLFLGSGDRDKRLEAFKKEIEPPPTPLKPPELPPIYYNDLESYLTGKPFPYYQPLSDRAVFFSVEIKRPSTPSAPEMNLECTEVVSTPEGFIATLRNPQISKTYKVKVADQVEIFTVVSITRDVITLSGEGKQYRLNPPIVTMPFKLTGIMPTETGFQAMLQSDTTKKTSFVNAGDEVESWKVLNIDENKVIISRPDAGKYELKIGGEFQRIKE